MIDFKYADLFKQNSVDIQLEIISDDKKIHITNTELHGEEFELTESLCSESELTFGISEAGCIKFKVSNVFLPMKEKWLNVKMTIGEHKDQPFLIGRFKGYSDKVTADRKYREVVAYDALYDIINKDVAAWYNSVFPSHEEQKTDKDGIASTVICYDPITMKQFRDSFFNYFGIEQADTILVNDSMYIEKTVEVTASSEVSSETTETSSIGESMSGQEVLSCICEINGCMGHMGRDGKFHYIYLEQEIQGVYPKNDLYPADDLYPKDPKSNRIDKDAYISAEYEDYLVKPIDRLQIREQKNDIGVIIGTGNNGYVIEDNFLVYGKGTNELTVAANNIFSKIKGIIYRPYQADCKGNPCLEVGDAVRFTTRYELIESYILSRTLNGIQALRDTISASGEEYRTEKVNSVHRDIIQLKGKSNVLERTIEETKSTITDVEEGLQSQITQNASEITAEVKRATDKEGSLSSRITLTENDIKTEVSRATGKETELNTTIQQTASAITAEVSKKVGNDEVRSKFAMDPSSVTIDSGKISFNSNTLVVDSDNFKLKNNGDATFSGTVSGAAITGSTITGGTITGSTITGGTLQVVGAKSTTDPTKATVSVGSANNGYVTFLSPGGCISRGPTHYTAMGHDAMGLHSRNGITLIELQVGTATDSNKNKLGLLNVNGSIQAGYDVAVGGALTVKGAKTRLVQTEHYNQRCLNAYETPVPMFGDVGEGKTDETGKCLIYLDDIFAETVDTYVQYQVFLQSYGEGSVYVAERLPSYFIVCGTPEISFGWEIKAVQAGFDTLRMDEYKEEDVGDTSLLDVEDYLEIQIGMNGIEEAETYLLSCLYDIEKESEDIAYEKY